MLVVGFVGLPCAGKSTAINSVAGKRVLQSGVCRTTTVATVVGTKDCAVAGAKNVILPNALVSDDGVEFCAIDLPGIAEAENTGSGSEGDFTALALKWASRCDVVVWVTDARTALMTTHETRELIEMRRALERIADEDGRLFQFCILLAKYEYESRDAPDGAAGAVTARACEITRPTEHSTIADHEARIRGLAGASSLVVSKFSAFSRIAHSASASAALKALVASSSASTYHTTFNLKWATENLPERRLAQMKRALCAAKRDAYVSSLQLSATTQGDVAAQWALGSLYYIERDDEKAAVWFGMAAAQGDAEARFVLGGMYEEGRGVRKDAPVAMELYRKAAAEGHADAQYRLGLVCHYGDRRFLASVASVASVEEGRIIGAAEWYTKAAAQGHSEAARVLRSMRRDDEGEVLGAYLELGIAYYTGQGVLADKPVGLMWLGLAATGENPDLDYLDWQCCEDARMWIRADEGDARACFEVGCYLEDRRLADSQLWINKAADMGDISAQSHLLYDYEYDDDTKNLARAAELLFLIASHDTNDEQLDRWDLREICSAQCRLGHMSLTGAEEWGIAKDRAAAQEWYKKGFETAARCDYGKNETNYGNEALYRLGLMSDDASGHTDLRSTEHYLAAAEKGHMLAQRKLGFLYYHRGDGSRSDHERAFRWLSASLGSEHNRCYYTYTHLDLGEAEAELLLAHMYLYGEGTDTNAFSAAFHFWIGGNKEKAQSIYDEIAEHGSAGDLYYLAWSTPGAKGVHGKAALLEKAAEKGHIESMDCLGMMHCNGRLPVDLDVAEKWFRKAAEMGHAVAKLRLQGEPLAQKPYVLTEAKRREQRIARCRKAADQGDADAQCCLGHIYYLGEDAALDLTEAAGWYRKAADQGNADAQSSLAHMYCEGKGVALDLAEAAEWYRKAADQGDERAQFWLSTIKNAI